MNIRRYGEYEAIETEDSAEDIDGLFEDGQLTVPESDS